MNLMALMEHVSRHLHTIVRKYSRNRTLIEQVCERTDTGEADSSCWDDHLEQEPVTEAFLLDPLPSGIPKVSFSPSHTAYMTIETEEFVFLVGPVLLLDVQGYRHLFPQPDYDSAWLQTLYSCDLTELVTESLLLYNLFHENILSLQDIVNANCLSEEDQFAVQKLFNDIIFENQENATKHNPYDQEIRELSSIRNGDLEQLEKSIAEDYVGTVGTLARTQLRSYQNIGIVLITLASRAAIDGGVLPEIAFSLSDSYIQKIEQLHIPEAAVQLARQAERQYAAMVREIKSARNAPAQLERSDLRIEQCKDYIFLHLHEKITTSDIAEALYLNPNYLTGLFKKKEGITPSEYIINQKVQLVKNMLIYSPYSYSTIAAYLGFSSQSHLSRQFKKVTGMTLRQYRETYGKRQSFS